ncbi:uncharacterized protein [Scyliorhinus torazame]|uniref:uncharacterized protein n=1 Tax=Scyliorhinus torazame TaxID=75743 RepID=UPI003B5A842E
MSLLWCSLPVFLAVVAGMVVMGQITRETLATTDSTQSRSAEVTQDGGKYFESTTENLTTPPPVDQSSSTPPPVDQSSSTPPPVDQSSSTPPPVDQSSPTSPPVDQSSSTPPPVDQSSSTPPPVDQSSSTPPPLDPTSTPLAPSTAGTPATSTFVYSTTGFPSHTTQDFNASQQATTVSMESSAFPGLETETDASQDSSPTPGPQPWTTEEPGTESGTSEVTSESAVTNTSEIGGHVHPDGRVKTQPPATSTLTSTKKQPTSFYLVTTGVTTLTTITKVNESMFLKPTISTVSKILRTSTRSYNRLSTAQVKPKKISLVAQCLIAIAILAGICTIFVICTVVLCTKLSSQRQNYRVEQSNGTELMCISALLPEEERKLKKKMRPKRLRDHFKEISAGQNSDSDDDDLTLHSFITEH